MILWAHETTLTTNSEAVTCQKKFRAPGFSEDGVSESFNLLERIVEYKVNYILIYGYNIYGGAFITFNEKTGQIIMEKYNISYKVNLKCEESSSSSSSCSTSSSSSSNCLLSPLLVARICEGLKHGAPPGLFLFHSEKSCVSKA